LIEFPAVGWPRSAHDLSTRVFDVVDRFAVEVGARARIVAADRRDGAFGLDSPATTSGEPARES
jgi:hypothetical protein